MFDQICIIYWYMSSSGKKEIMTYLEMDMPACVGDIGHQAAYLKTSAQLFNRRKSRNKKLKAPRCLQVNTYCGRMKHWPATLPGCVNISIGI